MAALLLMNSTACGSDEGTSAGSDSASVSSAATTEATTSAEGQSFASPMAMAEALGCADSFHDERPGGHNGVDHAECQVDGQVVTLYVLADDAAKQRWIEEVSGLPSEEAMEATGSILIEGTWALGNQTGLDLGALAQQLRSAG